MFNQNNLGYIEEYCIGTRCGEPNTNFGIETYSKRRMIFRGYLLRLVRPRVKYVCPVCGCEKIFANSYVGNHVVQISSRPCQNHDGT